MMAWGQPESGLRQANVEGGLKVSPRVALTWAWEKHGDEENQTKGDLIGSLHDHFDV